MAEQDAYNASVRGLSENEIHLFLRILRDGLQCFDLYQIDPSLPDKNEKGAPNAPNATAKEEKEVLEAFGAIFAVLEPATFLEIVTSQVGFLLEQMVANPTILGLPHYFLLNAAISPIFVGVLLRFLMDRIDLLGSGDSPTSATQAQVMLRLFKLIFMAVTVFPEKNEVVLQPHMSSIIRSSLKLSAKAKEPSNYFLLLRSMFRSIGGGRFELLYKEVLPLLPELLQSLNNLLSNAYKQQMRELFVELCLTVPVRLSALLPYLNFLMKPLVLALQSGPELVSQGLRTLELCIDNLTHDFLDPIVSPVIGDLMAALWRHLRPLPYNQTHSHTTMRILGKLGGRNRRILKDPPTLNVKSTLDSHVDAALRLVLSERTGDISTEQLLQVSDALDLVGRIMTNQVTGKDKAPHMNYYKEQGFLFLQACLPLVMDVESEPELAQIVKQSAAVIESAKTAPAPAETAPGSPKGTMGDALGDADAVMDDGLEAPTAAVLSVIDELAQAESSDTDKVRYQVPNKSRRDAHDRTVSQVVVALFAAACVPELEERAWSVALNVCKHFLLLHIPEFAVQKAGLKAATKPTISSLEVSNSVFASRIDAFVEGIVDVMTSESSEMRKKGGEALLYLHETCMNILGSREDSVEQLPVFHSLALRFCSYCFKQEWYRKNGGCNGISMFCSNLKMGTKWMVDHQLEFTKALLYVLKDTSSEMSTSNVEEARRTLSHVLKVCNQQEDNDDVQDRQNKVNNLIHLLVQELPNTNSAVRETIQESLQLLADLTGTEVTELLMPVRERLLGPIFAKPLRALPVPMQIGHIDAITYCLSLRPPLMQFNEELLRLMHEALALADAEDQALTSPNKNNQKSSPEQATQLRVVCIKLLSSAMAHGELSQTNQNSARARIIAVFFKSLYSKSSEVVEMAYKGLSQVLQHQHKLPKDLLQAGLRPILVNLSDYKKLTVQGLEGLARLLELLTTYFKNEIGRKLLDHLKAWAEPAVLEEASSRPLSEVDEIKIIVAILDAFPLLPQAANIYLEDLVNEVLDLEVKLKRFISSPFRQPLIKFLNRHATDALAYFYEQLEDGPRSRLFVDLLQSESAAPLRLEVMKNADKLLTKTFRVTPEENENADTLHFQGVLIVRAVALHQPEWLVQSR